MARYVKFCKAFSVESTMACNSSLLFCSFRKNSKTSFFHLLFYPKKNQHLFLVINLGCINYQKMLRNVRKHLKLFFSLSSKLKLFTKNKLSLGKKLQAGQFARLKPRNRLRKRFENYFIQFCLIAKNVISCMSAIGVSIC